MKKFSVITNNPNTWGMCCNKERAKECSIDFYNKHKKELSFFEHLSYRLVNFINNFT